MQSLDPFLSFPHRITMAIWFSSEIKQKKKKITFLLYLSFALARYPLGHTFFLSNLDAECENKDLEMVYI